jgi:hypothetical protein
MDFLKYPVNFITKSYKDLRLYCRFLDFKAQNIQGEFSFDQIGQKSSYYRDAKKLISKGWASKSRKKTISLRAYQHVWRSLGIQQVRSGKRMRYRYKKINVAKLELDRKTYLKQLEDIIRSQIANQKAAQIRWRLKQVHSKSNEATFSAKSAAGLFGYKSATSGSKLRKKYFKVNDIPGLYWSVLNKRYENHCSRIVL